MKWENRGQNVKIWAKEIEIGEDVIWGENINIEVNGIFKIGDYSRLGDDVQIRGNNIHFGDHLYHSSGLRVGGGGHNGPNANLTIGDRCTIHNNFLNVCEPIEIGNDVGLSQEVSLITHGYWMSVLEGNPVKFARIKINGRTILGYRTTVLPGVKIWAGTTVGANSVVTRDLMAGIWAGNPTKRIGERSMPSLKERMETVDSIIEKYKVLAMFHGMNPVIKVDYPRVIMGEFAIDVETLRYIGEENKATDHLRDYLRKWGIRIYTKRPFG